LNPWPLEHLLEYYLFKSERLSANIILTLHKDIIRSVATYAFPSWELAADTYFIRKIAAPCKPRFSASLEIFQGIHGFKLSDVYDYTTFSK
jgi:hypothetical protein